LNKRPDYHAWNQQTERRYYQVFLQAKGAMSIFPWAIVTFEKAQDVAEKNIIVKLFGSMR
jgi:hypothetical protein